MVPQFSERLNFLMSLTGTTNSALAHELSFDASYISRIRNGKRGVPLHQPFIEPAAAYLARRIKEPYQRQIVEQAIQSGSSWPSTPERAAKLIADWLRDSSHSINAHFDRLLESFPSTADQVRRIQAAGPEIEKSSGLASETHQERGALSTGFFGGEGKRTATLRFLSALVRDEKAHSLLLYSDEDMTWLTDDQAFLRQWALLLNELIEHGGNITIVHTVTRNVGEMLDAVQNWLPLYLTGHVRSYYCPRLRDGICRRTLFIAQGKLALTSNSIEEHTAHMPNLLTGDPALVAGFEREFENLLKLCKPLVSVQSFSDASEMKIVADAIDAAGGQLVVAYPATADSPEDCAKGITLRKIREALEQLNPKPMVTSRLPEHVIALVGETTGFALISLAPPQIVMHVSERLLSAAFHEYLLN